MSSSLLRSLSLPFSSSGLQGLPRLLPALVRGAQAPPGRGVGDSSQDPLARAASSAAGSKVWVRSHHPKCYKKGKKGNKIKRLYPQGVWGGTGALGPCPQVPAITQWPRDSSTGATSGWMGELGGVGLSRGAGGAEPLAGHLHLVVHVCALRLFEGHHSVICVQAFELNVPEDLGQQEAPQGHGEDEEEGQRQ